jgi:RNA-directed DNA polymerase
LLNSKNPKKKQTTQNRGHHVEVGVELRGKQGALSGGLALIKRESENNVLEDTSSLLERILARENMLLAMKRVIKNKGSHGVDGMRVDELRTFIIDNWLSIKPKLLEGRYKPSPVRRVEIPKPDGGIRLLGIPTTACRLAFTLSATTWPPSSSTLGIITSVLSARADTFNKKSSGIL